MASKSSYIGISFIVLVVGIFAVKEIGNRISTGTTVKGASLDRISTGKVSKELVKIGPAPSFSLTDQHGTTITTADYKGKVYVVEFFFSTCPSICPIVNRNMLDILNKFFGNPNFGIASITINPENDTPAVLLEHAKLLGVKSSNWHFLTGDKSYIFDLSNKGFNIYAGQNPKIQGGFEHSGLFALIDKKGFIRCRKDQYGNPILYYDGLSKEGVRDIQKDIQLLVQE